ncbi:MAG TPA: SNF2 helicase-associated domain-containing protein, partial [Prosthecobacter sp.]|nr:SNF2 helicase-associated domain-containing protein [Prosthecobacter sp.]
MLLPVLSPEGLILTEGEAESAPERKLAAAQPQGDVALLLLLGTSLLTADIEAPWRWLREWPRYFLTRLCQTCDPAAAMPSAEEQQSLLAAAPPFAGAEYLSSEVLGRWWQQMAAHAADLIADHSGGLEGWLRDSNPLWHAVGRVTFHLAENKADSQRPFAFLATFAEKLNASGKPQHLPLARALQAYAGQKNEPALNALLAPVRTAAERSALLREWLESRRLFQPQALSPQEAYRLLRESPVFQESGIVVKLPDWWRAGKGPRPAVQVTIDAPKGTSLNAGALLSFKLDASI